MGLCPRRLGPSKTCLSMSLRLPPHQRGCFNSFPFHRKTLWSPSWNQGIELWQHNGSHTCTASGRSITSQKVSKIFQNTHSMKDEFIVSFIFFIPWTSFYTIEYLSLYVQSCLESWKAVVSNNSCTHSHVWFDLLGDGEEESCSAGLLDSEHLPTCAGIPFKLAHCHLLRCWYHFFSDNENLYEPVCAFSSGLKAKGLMTI